MEKRNCILIVVSFVVVFLLGTLTGVFISMAYHGQLKEEMEEIVERQRIRTDLHLIDISDKLTDMDEEQTYFQKVVCSNLGVKETPKKAKITPTPTPTPTSKPKATTPTPTLPPVTTWVPEPTVRLEDLYE